MIIFGATTCRFGTRWSRSVGCGAGLRGWGGGWIGQVGEVEGGRSKGVNRLDGRGKRVAILWEEVEMEKAGGRTTCNLLWMRWRWWKKKEK